MENEPKIYSHPNFGKDTKILEGESVEQAAEKYFAKILPSKKELNMLTMGAQFGANWKNEQYTERVEGERSANLWQQNQYLMAALSKIINQSAKGHYATGHLHKIAMEAIKPVTTPSTSTTIDELAEGFEQMAFNEGFRDDILKYIVNLMQEAYNLRDKEQAGAVEKAIGELEQKLKDYLDSACATGYDEGFETAIEVSLKHIVEFKTNLLALIK